MSREGVSKGTANVGNGVPRDTRRLVGACERIGIADERRIAPEPEDRKSTRLNSSHSQISYAVFCLKKKKKPNEGCRVRTHNDCCYGNGIGIRCVLKGGHERGGFSYLCLPPSVISVPRT